MSETDSEDAALERLMALDLAWAEQAHAKAMAAESVDDVERLGRTYQRAARSLRQTVALRADLQRRRAAAAPKPVAPFVPDPEEHEADARVEELFDAVGRVIAAEHIDHPRRERLTWARFEREVDDWATEDILAIEDLDEHVLEVCRELGLSEELATDWRNLPDPYEEPDPYEVGEEDAAPEAEAQTHRRSDTG